MLCVLFYLNCDKYLTFQLKDLYIRYLSELVNYIWDVFKLDDAVIKCVKFGHIIK